MPGNPLSRLMPRRGRRLPLLLSAGLLLLSFPPLHLLVPPLVALVPLGVWMAGGDPGREGRREAVVGGLFFGTVYFGVLLYWIAVALVWFTPLAILAWVGSVLVTASITSLAFWAMHRMYHGGGVPIWLVLPLGWTTQEWLRAHLPGELAFPWLGLGSSLTGFPSLVGVAELVGSRGVTFWLALVNGLIAAALVAWRDRERFPIAERPGRFFRPSVAAVVLLTLPMGWGLWRAATLETRPAARVAVIQPNVPEHVKLDREAVFDTTFAALDTLMAEVEPGTVDLVAWPEVTLPEFAEAAIGRPVVERVGWYADRVQAPVLTGMYGFETRDDGGYDTYNSAFLIRPETGLDRGYRYDKRYLVPIVERVPILNPDWFGDWRFFGGLEVGQGWPLGRIETGSDSEEGGGTATFGVLICYESSYPEGARRWRLAGADFLVNMTNDAWYGREPWWSRTTALWQHPAHMVMRAIENRVGVARPANTGITLFVDPLGRISNSTRLFERTVRVDTVETTDVVTLFTRWGDWVGNGALSLTFLLLLVSGPLPLARGGVERAGDGKPSGEAWTG